MKVLIVEDDFSGRHLMKGLVSKYGNCDVAVNGQEAVELFKLSYQEGEPYNLILLDIRMPVMDGQEALSEIRGIEESYGVYGSDRAKIVMTTAYDDVENVLRAFDEQCDGYLIKPIEINKLDEILKKLEMV